MPAKLQSLTKRIPLSLLLVTMLLTGSSCTDMNVDAGMNMSSSTDSTTHTITNTGTDTNAMNETISTDSEDIYTRFLKNEITAIHDDQELLISELFWDNDIEYCFFDIDGDGHEELHIRDSAAYYAVKIQDGKPRILFEGWWMHEPVRTDSLCGVLCHFTRYYSEFFAFITIYADESQENAGSYYWYDENKNGVIDEEDTFTGHRGIDKDEFLRYKEKYVTASKQSELPWKNRRIQNFSNWQDAYADFIHTLHVTGWLPYAQNARYALVYIDDDTIPELYIETGGVTIHEIVVSFYDGRVRSMNRERAGMRYLEHEGLLYDNSGSMDFYPCNVYELTKGTFTEIGTGWYYEHEDEEGNLSKEYYWEGRLVTKTAYESNLRKLIDTTRCVEPSSLYTEKKFMRILTHDS